MKSTQRSITTGAVFGAAVFVLAFLGGTAITSTLGPGTSGVVTALFTTALVVFSGLVAPRFPTLLTTNLVFSVLAIPTTLFGPFGVAKVCFGLLTGAIYEIVVALMKRSKASFYVAAAVAASASVYMIFHGTLLFGKSPSVTLGSYLHYFAIAYGLLAILGAHLGLKLFARLEGHPSLARFRGE